jgi:hypothetical protein
VSDAQIERPIKTRRHIGQAISLRGLRSEVQRVDGVNALIGLPAALRPGGEGIIAWIAQTFLQLVLLSVIMVGQNVQSIASDLRSQHTYDDAVLILDRLDIHTAGGLKDLADRIDQLEADLRR